MLQTSWCQSLCSCWVGHGCHHVAINLHQNKQHSLFRQEKKCPKASTFTCQDPGPAMKKGCLPRSVTCSVQPASNAFPTSSPGPADETDRTWFPSGLGPSDPAQLSSLSVPGAQDPAGPQALRPPNVVKWGVYHGPMQTAPAIRLQRK